MLDESVFVFVQFLETLLIRFAYSEALVFYPFLNYLSEGVNANRRGRHRLCHMIGRRNRLNKYVGKLI